MPSDDLGRRLQPLLAGDLAAWRGLPDAGVEDFEAVLGGFAERGSVRVGAYPARRMDFAAPDHGRTLTAFARHHRVFMVQVDPPPDTAAALQLPEPTAVLPQEIGVAGAYAHELLYADRGLLLTMAEDLGQPGSRRLVRCRGIRPLANARELGAELYMPLDAEIRW